MTFSKSSASLEVPWAGLLNTIQCKPNHCDCHHGVGSEYKRCQHDGMHNCVSCDYGFHLTGDGICRKNQCECINGYPALGPPNCGFHGDKVCEMCLPKFYKTNALYEKMPKNVEILLNFRKHIHMSRKSDSKPLEPNMDKFQIFKNTSKTIFCL